ncbi:MAG: glycosyl hydrolase [Verrucomicrobia bacterium]|nr:MAG: glycosyl hydrolase [Verrucomicrobiota bacterium]
MNHSLTAKTLAPAAQRLLELSATKIRRIQKTWSPDHGTPVFTVKGRYTSRGWTEWTQGFQFGSEILQFDATGEREFLVLGRKSTVERMASHASHIGVHDHGFNNVSTYGNLWRLMREGRIPSNEWELNFYEFALKISGAVQAARWTQLTPELGYVYSFNGPHSLFSDTIRSMRSLALSHLLGHRLMGENDVSINLLGRLLQHAETTARYNVYFGEDRDRYDVRGRVAHESIFNLNDGSYRCPSTQQGYSPFSTWTRGLAWIILGYAEQLEFLSSLPDSEFVQERGRPRPRESAATRTSFPSDEDVRAPFIRRFEQVASACCDFWIEQMPTDGVSYWDTDAPGLAKLGDWAGRAADPFNEHEPVDSSAAVIAAQGLIRYGNYLNSTRRRKAGKRYYQAGLTVASHLFQEPYLSTDPKHQGLILHSIYHRPKGWDYIPPGRSIPCGESSMWGDYHARELGLMILREAKAMPYFCFFATTPKT